MPNPQPIPIEIRAPALKTRRARRCAEPGNRSSVIVSDDTLRTAIEESLETSYIFRRNQVE